MGSHIPHRQASFPFGRGGNCPKRSQITFSGYTAENWMQTKLSLAPEALPSCQTTQVPSQHSSGPVAAQNFQMSTETPSFKGLGNNYTVSA